ILSPRFGGPVIGGIHDHISGSFLLTHKESKFTREEVTFILSKIDMRDLPQPDIKKGGKEFWSGKALFSAILPKNLSMTFKSSIEKVEGLVESYKRGELEQMPGRSLEETLEVEAMKILGRARDQAGQIAGKHLGIENSAVIMARSGARGSMLNLSQMAGSIGQQAVRGERLSRGYWNRTLPHFKKGDLGAEAKGFVKSSYKSG